jgi:hypothetical protein
MIKERVCREGWKGRWIHRRGIKRENKKDIEYERKRE